MVYLLHYRTLLIFLISISLTGVWSCADFNLKYDSESNGWDSIYPAKGAELAHTIYLIGDGGYAPMNKSTPLFDHLKKTFSSSSQESAAIWLGDNIYTVGLAPEGHPDHPLGCHRITAQLKTLTEFQGKVFFIPGNHDWYEYGQKGLKRQEDLVESFLSNKKSVQVQHSGEYFIPDNGCGDPTAKRLSDDIVLIVIDSHWYLKGRYSDETKKEHCSVKTHEDYLSTLDLLFKEHEDDIIVLATHHPPYTYGKHGGFYQPKYYFFPLTQINNALIIPLPFSGIIANIARPYISEQDTKYALYTRYREEIVSRAASHGKTVITSGHEHNLQYIERDGIPFIISGSGSKKTEVALGDGSRFAIGEYGYTILRYYSNGQVIVHYIAAINDKYSEVFRASLWK